MIGPIRRLAMHACTFAVCGSFAVSAFGQVRTDQVQVGLERALKTPTEIIWLRDEILAGLWRNNARLADSPARCGDSGNPRQGCTIGNPPSWRYVFGAGSNPDHGFKPLTSGVYFIVPHAKQSGLVRAPSGEILLAAGASVQLIDAAYPGIQIELSAPPDQPLPLGNLSAAEAGRIFGLLARQPGTLNATAVSELANGRVALKSAAEVQLAAAKPVEAVAPKAAPAAVEVAMLAPPRRVVEQPQAPEPLRPVKFDGSIDLSRFIIGEASKPIPDAEPKHDPVPRLVAAAPQPAALETPGVVPVAPAPVVAEAQVVLASATPSPAASSQPVAVARASTPVARTAEAARVAGPNPDLVRMRAEIEAEIERDRTRIAAVQQQACSSTARPMQGCTIGAPRRFAFAG